MSRFRFARIEGASSIDEAARLFAKLSFENLAERIARKFVNNEDVLRLLVTRDETPHLIDDRFRRGFAPRRWFDKGGNGLTINRIQQAAVRSPPAPQHPDRLSHCPEASQRRCCCLGGCPEFPPRRIH